jgi:hypothetical protein
LEQKNEIWKDASPKDISNAFTAKINNRLSVRIYKDCRPACLETAPLQKGLVLVLDQRELIEEGLGFGVPVVKYADKTYFSGSARSWMETEEKHPTLVKSFNLNMISRKRIGNGPFVNDNLYHILHRAFEIGYINYQGLARASNKIMELRKTFNINTEFIKVKSRGSMTFKYSCRPNKIEITMESSLLELNKCNEIVILNEQGSTFFRRYTDSTGHVLFDRGIGAWTKIMADEASFSDTEQTFSFTIKNRSYFSLFRGWEKTKKRFSWAGLAYSLPPRQSTFDYSIRLSLLK